MELQFPSFLILFFAFLLFLYTVLKLLSAFSSAKLPPGPRKLPIIGNLHQLKGAPHRSLKELAEKHGPIIHLLLGELRTTVISSAECAKEVLTTHDVIFAQRPKTLASQILSYNFLDIGFAPYGTYWRQLRRICKLELLSQSRVDSFRSIREEEVTNLVKEISSCRGSPIDLSKKLFSMTSWIAMSAAFGKHCKHKEEYISAAYRIIKHNTGFTLVNLFPSFKVLEWISGARPKLEKLHREKDKIVQKILDEHKDRREKRMKDGEQVAEDDEEDQIDLLLKLREQGDLEFPLTDDAIKAILWDLVTAGAETSSSTMEWAMTEMLRFPESMKEAQVEVRRVYGEKGRVDESNLHELQYLKAVVKETLRLHPPSPLLMPRQSSEACQISGYDIPANTRVIINAFAIGRDPKFWPEPEKFSPERFLNNSIDYKGMDFEYIPFGAGRRMCPGIYFAQANIELLLAQLLFHFDWKLPEGMRKEDIDMGESFGLAVCRKVGLAVIPIPWADN
ncbi:hypothetical protein P3X46_035207 [Hevea brasiliensis]|uniref:Cytochrome P450 n=1 Tax=Hevea brasiliensis TaxID=3981 RepID=A0ABQ9K9S3_HEVBR|nr:cytochrome P450 71D10 [Hevea brasiliensis]KAJ9128406.1 hypothetical protein P3X46_035207 [Hevea brasiliensis]